MQATFYILLFIALLGAALDKHQRTKAVTLRRDRGKFSTAPRSNRIWLAVDYTPSQQTITVTVEKTARKSLIDDIEVITDRRISADSWDNLSYSDILGSLTLEQINDIKSYREFLT